MDWSLKVRILLVLTILVAVLLAPLTLLLGLIVLPGILLFWNMCLGLAQKPVEVIIVRKAAKMLAQSSARKIVVLGSYGKTTAKEILATVLGAKASQGNQNTLISLAKFAIGLKGNEKILIFELGEFRRGDIKKMCHMIQPDYAVFTGASKTHLDTLGNLEGVIETLNEVRDFVLKSHIAVNADNPILKQQPAEWYFSEHGVNNDKISNLQLSIEGAKFDFLGQKIGAPFLGRHNVAIVAWAVYFAEKVLFYDKKIVAKNLNNLKVFPHRMEPRKLNGSFVIDDTYNGNIEGVRAGLELVKNLPMKHKIFVTPGLVEQGQETAKVHREIGGLIAKSQIDQVYLIQNSTTKYIREGLKKSGFKGKVEIITNPLDFYENLEAITMPDQVILMQNDWGDNYA